MLTTLRGARCVITGGAGFVGSHLLEALLSAGAQVISYDRSEKILPDGVTAVVGDLSDGTKLQETIHGSDVVFHLAALASVQDSIEHPVKYYEVNVGGSMNVLEAARTSPSKPRVILASSAAVYGDQDIVCTHEALMPKPKSPYALSKMQTEEMAKLWSELYGVETVSIRPFNIYGSRMNSEGAYASAIGRFLKLTLEGLPIQLTGDGTQTRDYVHVRDMVSAYIASALSPSVGNGEIINIASGKSVSIKSVAELISVNIEYIPARVEIKDSGADITRARELLTWSPHISLEEGIAELKVEWGIV